MASHAVDTVDPSRSHGTNRANQANQAKQDDFRVSYEAVERAEKRIDQARVKLAAWKSTVEKEQATAWKRIFRREGENPPYQRYLR